MKLDRWKMGVLLFLVFCLLVYLFYPNFLRLAKTQQQISALEDEIAKLELHNRDLEEQIKKLKNDPVSIEKVAREELGMSKPKEIIYKFDDVKEEEHS
ncbi:MAG: septum formation initiator family protein [Chlamydiae bacterium]|nr:septum formation initiator family protein [Chlamydiota bacterium]